MRTFDFDAPVNHFDAIAAIVAALEDEGLGVLNGDNAKSRIYSVRLTIGGRFVERYHVPAWRIVAR